MIKAVKAVKPLLPSPPPGDYSTYNVERHAPPLEHLLKRRNGSRRWSELGGLDLCTNSTAFAVPTSNHNSHACALWRRLGSLATSSGSSPGAMPAETSQSASFDFCCAALCPVTSGHPSGKSQLWAGPCAKPAVDLGLPHHLASPARLIHWQRSSWILSTFPIAPEAAGTLGCKAQAWRRLARQLGEPGWAAEVGT